MLNHRSIEAVAAARRDAATVVPLYDTFGFARLPELVRGVFTGSAPTAWALGPLARRYEAVVFFLIDGFGWSLFERFADELPFLRRALGDGFVSKLTAQFPSTTAAHVTTLHTGLPVAESGVLEWFYYEPRLDAIFAPLLHATVGPESLLPLPEGAAEALYPSRTLYQELAGAGVSSRCHQHVRYAGSPYSRAVTQGAERVPYRTLPEAFVNLVEDLRRAEGPTYHCVYVDVIDGTSHGYGPSSLQVAAETRALFWLLEEIVASALSRLGRDVLVLLSADHGHADVDPSRTIYLDELLPESVHWMKSSAGGQPLLPAGSSRDLFLYVKEAHLEEAERAIAEALDGRARVRRTETLLAEGWFGPSPGPRLRERLGDLVVLPEPHEMVWWRAGGRFTEHKRGHHGGVTPEEIEIPLLAWAP